MKTSAVVAGLAGLSFSVILMAAPQPSMELGKHLFSDPQLGHSRNNLSCATCHAGGAKLENADKNPDLSAQINRCIAGPLKGETLASDSEELKSLVMYVESFSKGDKKKQN